MSGLGRGVEKHADRKAGRCALPLHTPILSLFTFLVYPFVHTFVTTPTTIGLRRVSS